MLRIACEGNDVGAEVSVNGKFKGECPLDMQVGAGTLQLRLVKKVDNLRERMFEQEIRMGDGVVKKVEAQLGPAQFTVEGRRVEGERQRQEQEVAKVREENRRREIALAAQQRQEQLVRKLAEFKANGIEPGNGKSFRDCAECPEMVMVPPGRLVQRIPPANSLIGWLNQVNIAYPLAIGKFEVTYDEWDACVADRACKDATVSRDYSRSSRGRVPVNLISRADVKVYLAWLSKKTGESYRLLSLAEFIYAARAGRATKLPWGDELGSNNANCKNCGSRWDGEKPAPVGSFKPNDWGLYDMIGNVAEMVADCPSDATKFDVAPKDGSPLLPECRAVPPLGFIRADFGDRFMTMGGAYGDNIDQGVPLIYENSPSAEVGFRVARTYQPKPLETDKVK